VANGLHRKGRSGIEQEPIIGAADLKLDARESAFLPDGRGDTRALWSDTTANNKWRIFIFIA
jgi:hypothetical protein